MKANVKAIRTILLAALILCFVPAEAAHAQFLFWPHYAPWSSKHSPVRHKKRHQRKKTEPAKGEQVRETPNGPLQIVVSIGDQRISVYDNGALIARSSVSTGVPRHPTPLGVFSVIGKKQWHRSNLYSAAPMPYMQRLTWSGIALHAGVLPGYPASHGCIRLKRDFAIRLWHLTKRGTRVIIAPEDIQPVEIANSSLFAAKANADSGTLESAAAAGDNAIMTAQAVESSLTPYDHAQQVTDLKTPDSTRPTVAPRNVVPISIFVSRKLSRLFVRQGFTPLFDSPVGIQDPEEPLGTHVFTAMEFPGEGIIRWTAVSMPEKPPRMQQASNRPTPGNQFVGPRSPSPDKALAALNRILIPQDAVERIAERLTPGSSLILSDYGISKETGKGTDFIVVMQ